MKNPGLLSLFFFLAAIQATGQIHHSRQYTIRDGLPSNNVRVVFKDSRDILWVGTDGGLTTYDGSTFTRFPLPTDSVSRKVWAITEDPEGNLWFGTFGGGLVKFDGRDFTIFSTPQLTSDFIRVLQYSERYNSILVGTQFGFNSITNGEVFSFVPDTTVANNRFLVMSFIENQDGIIFHTFRNNTWHFKPNTLEVKELSMDSPLFYHSSSMSFVSSRGDTIFGLDRYGLRIVGKEGIKEFYDMGQVFGINEDANGLIWIAVWSHYNMHEPGGLYTFDGKSLRNVGPSWNINARLMWNTFIDPVTETIFLTTEGDGLFKLINKGISRFHASFFGAETLEIYDIQIFRDNLWITANDRVIHGNQENGFKVLDDNWFNQRKTFPGHHKDSIPDGLTNKFLSIHIDEEQNLWIGSNHALYKLINNNPDFYTIPIPTRWAENFIVLPNGRLYSATEVSMRMTHNVYAPIVRNILSDNNIHPFDVIHILPRKDEFWFCSYSRGLYRYKNDQFKWYGDQHPYLPRNLNAICLDRDKNLIIGTNDGNIFILEGSDSLSVMHEINENHGIIGNEILWLLNDSENRLWIGTNMGINIVNLNDLYDTGAAFIHYINESEGFTDFSARKAIQDKNGIVWIGGTNNLIKIDPEKLLQKPQNRQRIEFTEFSINFKPVNWDSIAHSANIWRNVPVEKVTLTHRQNNLSFSWKVDNLLNPEKVVYSYFLKGFSDDHSEFTSRKEVTFTNLDPGRYTLLIQAKNLQTGLYYEPLEVSFRIRPPWWQTWYFYFTMILLALAITVFIIRYREAQVKKIERLKLESEKRLNSIRIQAIQAQMNPHFVFNVLSSIQCYMLDNDMDTTLEYLNDFSILIRTTMDNISEETIFLSDEIDYLKRYIKLENLRLGNSVTVKIIADPDVEARKIRIPPMIIQPFVENALKHGLAPVDGNKILFLQFNLAGNILQIKISDNGTGIQSNQINYRSGAYHRSKGIRNTTERIHYFTQPYNGSAQSMYGVSIQNRQKGKKIKGVEVKINLPVIE